MLTAPDDFMANTPHDFLLDGSNVTLFNSKVVLFGQLPIALLIFPL